MPKGLIRFQNCGVFHFITFSCFRREPLLAQRSGYAIFEEAFERVRRSHKFIVSGYVLMPEHVHLLVNEPQKGSLATSIQILKQTTSKKLKHPEERQFWQRRYYDFNVGPKKSASKSYATCIATRSSASWCRNRRTGHGRVFIITPQGSKEPSKSNPSGPQRNANKR